MIRRDLDRFIAAIGPFAMVQAIPNNMLAGPCQGCVEAAAKAVLAKDAPLPPFDGCPHPDQCAVRYRLIFDAETDYDHPQ